MSFQTPNLGGILAALVVGLLVEFWWVILPLAALLVWREKRRKIP